jgi:adenosylmethionine-8-amino-7-oxononanoate aminotransferase
LVLAEKLSNALSPLAMDSRVKHFRQQGMIWAFDAHVDDPQLAATFSRRFFASALKHELLLRPIGTTVYLMPPYILSDADTGLLAERLQTVFDEVMRA